MDANFEETAIVSGLLNNSFLLDKVSLFYAGETVVVRVFLKQGMVGWQRHLQSLLRQAGRRFEQSRISALYPSYHSKAAPVLGSYI